MLGVLASVPSSTDLMASIGSYSSPLFSDLLPFIYVIGGLIVGVGLLILIIKGLTHAFGSK